MLPLKSEFGSFSLQGSWSNLAVKSSLLQSMFLIKTAKSGLFFKSVFKMYIWPYVKWQRSFSAHFSLHLCYSLQNDGVSCKYNVFKFKTQALKIQPVSGSWPMGPWYLIGRAPGRAKNCGGGTGLTIEIWGTEDIKRIRDTFWQQQGGAMAVLTPGAILMLLTLLTLTLVS